MLRPIGTKLRDIGIGVLTRETGLVLVGVGFNRCRTMRVCSTLNMRLPNRVFGLHGTASVETDAYEYQTRSAG